MTAFEELAATMTRLRSPGGCPWDAQQTHGSLVTFLLEEAYELAEAIERDDGDEHLVEELGDVLLQVVFHAEIANQEGRFDLELVAARLVEKLQSRHPHVFGDAAAADAATVAANWDALKRAEKPERESALDGIPVALPALARAAKVASRARRAGLPLPRPEAAASPSVSTATSRDSAWAADGDAVWDEPALGAALLGLVVAADRQGLDPERALRGAARQWEARLRAAERA